MNVVFELLMAQAKELEAEKTPEQRAEEARRALEWEEEKRRIEKAEESAKERIRNAVPTGTLRANKTNLRKVIRWSSSRYNEWRKEEVVEDVIKQLQAGVIGIHTYTCGSYTPSSDMSRSGTYHLVIGAEGAKLIIEDGPVYRLT